MDVGAAATFAVPSLRAALLRSGIVEDPDCDIQLEDEGFLSVADDLISLCSDDDATNT